MAEPSASATCWLPAAGSVLILEMGQAAAAAPAGGTGGGGGGMPCIVVHAVPTSKCWQKREASPRPNAAREAWEMVDNTSMLVRPSSCKR